MSTLWDTTGGDIVKALSAERRSAGAVTSGLVLSLVVVASEDRVTDAFETATSAAAQHPCRLLVVVRRQPDAPAPRLDAEVQVGGRLGPIEAVVMRMYGRLALHAESVVLPLLASDAPVVTWWAGPPPDRIENDPLGVFAGRRVTDSALTPDPPASLQRRAADYRAGDTDLGWPRLTPWRSVLASAYDSVHGRTVSARVEAAKDNTSARLLAGWLDSRLGVTTEVTESKGPGITLVSVQIDGADGPLELAVSRTDGRNGVLHRTGHADRPLPLERRNPADLLAEELRRLDVDQVYGESLHAAFGMTPQERSRPRTHVWKDAVPA